MRTKCSRVPPADVRTPTAQTDARWSSESTWCASPSALAGDYTVVTDDPRGIGNSSREDTTQDVTPGQQAGDVHRLLSALGGGTGHTVTMTEITHGVFDAGLSGPNPCSGADIVSVDASGNVVNHVTFFPAGDEVWATFTETGKITLLDSNGVIYTGHLTVWGNFNMNEQNSNNTFTLTLMLTGSDGSAITVHEVQHFALNANGVVTVSFDRMNLTCG